MAFTRASEKDFHKDELRINGMFVYAVRRKHPPSRTYKTDAYLDRRIMLDARFSAKGFQDGIGGILRRRGRSCGVSEFHLSVVAYRKRNFGVTDVSRAFLKSTPIER